jgi:cbb3-type cytochrome oxidase cytochrome c subunit
VLSFLVGRELLNPEWAERLLSWRHTGFNVHSQMWTKMKPEAERMGKYMIKTPAAIDTLFPALI